MGELDVTGEDNSELALEGVKLTDLVQDSSNNGQVSTLDEMALDFTSSQKAKIFGLYL
jgi:hypothetical protein